MALDSKEKRAAVPGVGRPWYRTKLPGTVDAAWRVASGNAYPVAAFAAPSITLPSTPTIFLDQRMNLDPILLDRIMGGDILLDGRMNLDPVLLERKLDS